MSQPAPKQGTSTSSPPREDGFDIRIVRGSGSVTQDEAEARLHREGFDAFRWYDVPGATYPSHRHSQDECVWVLKGEIEFEMIDQRFELRAGDRLYLPAGTRHTATVPRSAGVTYLIGRRSL